MERSDCATPRAHRDDERAAPVRLNIPPRRLTIASQPCEGDRENPPFAFDSECALLFFGATTSVSPATAQVTTMPTAAAAGTRKAAAATAAAAAAAKAAAASAAKAGPAAADCATGDAVAEEPFDEETVHSVAAGAGGVAHAAATAAGATPRVAGIKRDAPEGGHVKDVRVAPHHRFGAFPATPGRGATTQTCIAIPFAPPLPPTQTTRTPTMRTGQRLQPLTRGPESLARRQ